jgi:CheY-like chemotaxis protein
MPLPIKIIVAEDDPDDQEILQTFLERDTSLKLLPFANNGVELLAALDDIADNSGLPDLVVLDQNMPRLNGLQTLLELKSLQRYRHIPVVVYSTYINDHLTKQCLHDGAILVISKPHDKAGYEKMIATMLRVASDRP